MTPILSTKTLLGANRIDYVAQRVREIYNAFRIEGFSEEEAFELVKIYFNNELK